MFYTYFLLFFIYSVIGWIMEIGLCLFNEKKIKNRGFLLGPYCPIYGCGCLLLTFFLSKYENDILVLFGLSIIICSVLEYVTSWIMEKLFKMRWWDYTQMKFNINGRICLETMVPFAVLGVIIIKYTNPFFLSLINKMSHTALIIVSIILMSIIVVDIIISCNVIFNLKQVTTNLRKDSTQEIKKEVHKVIHNNLFMYDRIIKAFPNMSKIIKEQKEKTEKLINKHKKSKKK